jgi:hypothetical protein
MGLTPESAGVTALIKTATIPSLATGDFTCKFQSDFDRRNPLARNFRYLTAALDYGSELVIWGTAESAVTIIAASIPVLRVFFQEATKTARARYATEDTVTRKSRIGRSFVVVTANQPPPKEDKPGGSNNRQDDCSDRSILSGVGNNIVQTNEIRVESHENGGWDSDGMGYEMHAI